MPPNYGNPSKPAREPAHKGRPPNPPPHIDRTRAKPMPAPGMPIMPMPQIPTIPPRT